MENVNSLDSPIGIIKITASDKGIRTLTFVDQPILTTSTHGLIDQCKQQLQEYFTGQRQRFDLPFDVSGTPFQRAIWQGLMDIPYGQTASYQSLAEQINNPKAARAVGAANGKNPIAIIVPCHRVIGSNGSLTGYAWGVERKQWLLNHENNIAITAGDK